MNCWWDCKSISFRFLSCETIFLSRWRCTKMIKLDFLGQSVPRQLANLDNLSRDNFSEDNLLRDNLSRDNLSEDNCRKTTCWETICPETICLKTICPEATCPKTTYLSNDILSKDNISRDNLSKDNSSNDNLTKDNLFQDKVSSYLYELLRNSFPKVTQNCSATMANFFHSNFRHNLNWLWSYLSKEQ